MLAKDGFLDIEEIKDIPGFPGQEVLTRKKCVVIECQQNIPCNPCEAACPHNAITVGEPITNLPVIDAEKCIGCGLCVAKCPGQAIFLVDLSQEDFDTVTIPYEYYPLPEKGQEVYCLSRAGEFLTMGNVVRVVMTKANDRTAVVEIKVPKGYGMDVRGLSTDKKRMAATSEPNKTAEKLQEEINEDDMYVCRCEEITKGEIRRAVYDGMRTTNEVKRYLRAGMGLCQGQTCQRLVQSIIASELKTRPSELGMIQGRAPVRPVEILTFSKNITDVKED